MLNPYNGIHTSEGVMGGCTTTASLARLSGEHTSTYYITAWDGNNVAVVGDSHFQKSLHHL